MTYDLIIVSRSDNPSLIRHTQQTIDSARADTGKINVILVETGPKQIEYRDVDRHVMYRGEFNYNSALNQGLKYRKSQIQILANNDLIFRPGWSKIGKLMKDNGYLSGSALSNDARQRPFKRGKLLYEGYTIGFELAGWCIFCDSGIWDKIHKLSERHRFWFSDNVYAEQLKSAGIKHALFCNCHVDHLGSRTLRTLDHKTQVQYTQYEVLYAKREATRKADTKDIQKKV